jgi:hypothetical protein
MPMVHDRPGRSRQRRRIHACWSGTGWSLPAIGVASEWLAPVWRDLAGGVMAVVFFPGRTVHLAVCAGVYLHRAVYLLLLERAGAGMRAAEAMKDVMVAVEL